MHGKSTMLIAGLMLACGAVVALQASVHATDDHQSPRPILINLTAGPEDIQQASAALMFADSVRKAGGEVHLLLNVRAVELADKDSVVPMYKRRTLFSASLQTMIAEGLKVVAFPYSLKVADMTEDDLIEGITVAQAADYLPSLDNTIAVFSY